MVYLFGISGFIGGFILGLFVISLFLKDKSRDELVKDKSYHWKYGVLVWLIAAFTSWASVQFFREYFS